MSVGLLLGTTSCIVHNAEIVTVVNVCKLLWTKCLQENTVNVIKGEIDSILRGEIEKILTFVKGLF